MKPATAQITRFLQQPDAAVRVVLIYGPDSGLVRERADGLARKVVSDLQDPFRVTALTAAQVSEDPQRLQDEMAAMALGGGRRLIRIPHAQDSNAKAVELLLKNMPPSDALTIIEAGDLDKRSRLRALCEQEPTQAIAIPCYVEGVGDRIRTINEILAAAKLTAPRDVVQYLADVLPPDRIALRSEVEKLTLFAHGQKTVTLADVHAVVQDAGAAELDELVNAAALGQVQQVTLLLQRLFAEQTAPVAILRAAQRHFMRLQQARALMADGMNAADAVKKLQPPVFWKYQESMAKQAQRWPLPELDAALQKLLQAEAEVKKTGTPDQALCGMILGDLAPRMNRT